MKNLDKFSVLLRLILPLLYLGSIVPSYAVVEKNAREDSWKCSAADGKNQIWIAEGTFERMAINKAMEACKRQSQLPTTCKVAKENCESFLNGSSTQGMWRCEALDQMSKVWSSDQYKQRDDAALGARAYCQEHSSMPDTCYVNLLTCKNVLENS